MWNIPGVSGSKESACSVGDSGSISGSGRLILWRKEWLPTLLFLSGEFHGQRSLVGCSPQVTKNWTQLSNEHFIQHLHIPTPSGHTFYVCLIPISHLKPGSQSPNDLPGLFGSGSAGLGLHPAALGPRAAGPLHAMSRLCKRIPLPGGSVTSRGLKRRQLCSCTAQKPKSNPHRCQMTPMSGKGAGGGPALLPGTPESVGQEEGGLGSFCSNLLIFSYISLKKRYPFKLTPRLCMGEQQP